MQLTRGTIRRILGYEELEDGARVQVLEAGIDAFVISDGELQLEVSPDSVYNLRMLRVGDEDFSLGISYGNAALIELPSLALAVNSVLVLDPVLSVYNTGGSIHVVAACSILPCDEKIGEPTTADEYRNPPDCVAVAASLPELSRGAVQNWTDGKVVWPGCGRTWGDHTPPTVRDVLQVLAIRNEDSDTCSVWVSDGVHRTCLRHVAHGKTEHLCELDVIRTNARAVFPVSLSPGRQLRWDVIFRPGRVIGEPALLPKRGTLQSDPQLRAEVVARLQQDPTFLELPQHVQKLLLGVDWTVLGHAYGVAAGTPSDLLDMVRRGQGASPDQFVMSALHQGSLYTASVASVPILVELLKFSEVGSAAHLNVAHCIFLISASSSGELVPAVLSPGAVADAAAVEFPWDKRKSCVSRPIASEHEGSFARMPTDVLRLLLSWLTDLPDLVAVALVCKRFCAASFDVRSAARAENIRLRDTAVACRKGIVRAAPRLAACIGGADPVDVLLFTVMYHTRWQGARDVALQTLKDCNSRAAPSAALYLGVLGVPIPLHQTHLTQVAHAYGLCVGLREQAPSSAVETLIAAIDSGQIESEKRKFVRCCHFLWEQANDWRLALCNALCCVGRRGLRPLLPLFPVVFTEDCFYTSVLRVAFVQTNGRPVDRLDKDQCALVDALLALPSFDPSDFRFQRDVAIMGLPTTRAELEELVQASTDD
jgi:hypothetical protein